MTKGYSYLFPVVATAVILLLCSLEQPPAEAATVPDLIVINADVITVHSTIPGAEAFAIADGKFVAVGTTDEILSLTRKFFPGIKD